MIPYRVLLPTTVEATYGKVAKYLPDMWKDAGAFYALYSAKDSAFFEVGTFDGAFWLTNLIPGWKATAHVVLWGKDVLKQPERAKQIVRELFNMFSLKRMDSFIPARNRGAQRYAEKLGFSMEGVLRKQAIYNGEPEDVAVYSILKEEL